MRVLLMSVLLGLGARAGAHSEKTVPRWVEFRDGSLLRLEVENEPLAVTVIRPDGRVDHLTLRPSRFKSVALTAAQDFAQKQAVLSAVQQLGSEDFRQREQAQAALRKLGPAIRADLQACLGLTTEAETRARLRSLLAFLPAHPSGQAATAAPFDRIESDRPLWGYLGERGIPVLAGGRRHLLRRQDVRALTAAPPSLWAGRAANVPEGFVRLAADAFPAGCIEESFERTPEGRPLRIGENIEKLFLAKGFLLSTSVAGSYVSVNNFAVQGKSRGLSVATHRPLWEGEITVTFVESGHPDIPGGVTHFGCWIAAVVPGGTALVAFDHAGRQLGRIHTQKHGTDFLGVRSSVPIHKVRIIPNLELDRDYTLDDFIFLTTGARDLAHPDRCAVLTTTGERILCQDAACRPGGFLVIGMPGNLPDRLVPFDQVRQVNAPRPVPPPGPSPDGVFAELRDGSVLFGRLRRGKHGTPAFTHWPRILQEKDKLAGLRGSRFPRLVKSPSSGQAVIWDDEAKDWRAIAHVRLLEEIVLWKAGKEFGARGYCQLPPLWLSPAVAGSVAGSWHLRTSQGDVFVLPGPESLSGSLRNGIAVQWHGESVRIEPAALQSIEALAGRPTARGPVKPADKAPP